MKKPQIGVVCFLFAFSAFPQALIFFENNVPGEIVTRVYAPLPSNPTFHQAGNGPSDYPAGPVDWSSFTPIGANGTNGMFGGDSTFTQLLGAYGSNQPESSLEPGFPVATFLAGVHGGIIRGGDLSFTNISLNASAATIEMVAWDNSSGIYPTWTQAQVAWRTGLIAAGESGSWTQPLFLGPPDFMINQYDSSQHVVSFNLYYIPEPGVLWFAVVGVTAAPLRRLRPRFCSSVDNAKRFESNEGAGYRLPEAIQPVRERVADPICPYDKT